MLGGAIAVLVECDVLQVAPQQGRERARPYIDFARKAGILSAEGWVQNALALVDVAQDSVEATRGRLESLLRRLETAPAYDQIGRARWMLGVVLRLSGDLGDAEGEAQLLLAHAKAGRNELLEAVAHHLLGRVALARDALTEADAHLHEALAIAARRDFRPQTLSVYASRARGSESDPCSAGSARPPRRSRWCAMPPPD